jgi:hypothetical protein
MLMWSSLDEAKRRIYDVMAGVGCGGPKKIVEEIPCRKSAYAPMTVQARAR